MKALLKQDALMSLLSYDEHSGEFTWKDGSTRQSSLWGKKAGAINGRGYMQISVNGRLYLAHRLAWLYVNGSWPENEIDHINQDKQDNRIANLRDVTRQQNEWNQSIPRHNTSGYLGVSFVKSMGKWQAKAWYQGKIKTLGNFTTPLEASDAYQAFCSMHRAGFHQQ